MYHVQRNAERHITALTREPLTPEQALAGGWEPIKPTDPEVHAYAADVLGGANNPLSATDIGMIRVVEDLIDLLINKGTILFTDLPHAAQGKLLQRRTARVSLSRLSLLNDTDDDGVI